VSTSPRHCAVRTDRPRRRRGHPALLVLGWLGRLFRLYESLKDLGEHFPDDPGGGFGLAA